MTGKFLGLLRGVNVGGKCRLPMAELRASLENAGFKNVQTYIQSGNVIFDSDETDILKLDRLIEQIIANDFELQVPVVVFAAKDWLEIVRSAPQEWGNDPEWKHNMLILLRPYNMDDVIQHIGQLKPDIEMLIPGNGILYQSMSFKLFGRTTTGKLAAKPIYSRMTIRNYNTCLKLAHLLEA